ncbi:hypothetical protein RRG08_033908 [Elysia crispata]|uniref:Uncharacterized protein n=1 Tax=Elysia crispata TaxID=231223 RepID=A0AAE1B956_9GAST|nr:hypothetical protein RRG08_033908 [Elysia crispata]
MRLSNTKVNPPPAVLTQEVTPSLKGSLPVSTLLQRPWTKISAGLSLFGPKSQRRWREARENTHFLFYATASLKRGSVDRIGLPFIG